MDRTTHARFLEYREKFTYFGRGGMVRMDAATFEAADREQRELAAKGDTRDDEEEARFEELTRLLMRD
jgi:hypothetical protein